MSPSNYFQEEDPEYGCICEAKLGKRCKNPLKSLNLMDPRERDLPPLPHEAGYMNRALCSQNPHQSLPVLLKPSTPFLQTPPLVSTSNHDFAFLTCKSNPLIHRPKLRLETGWKAQPSSLDSLDIDDASSSSCQSFDSSRHDSAAASPTSQDGLVYFSSEDLTSYQASSIQDVIVNRSLCNSTSKAHSKNKNILDAVRLPKLSAVIRSAHKKASTTRAVSEDNVIVKRAKPFMRSDPDNPFHGITITVHQHRFVSEPLACPSAISLLSSMSIGSASVYMDKPLPTPAELEELYHGRDLPETPLPSDDEEDDGPGEDDHRRDATVADLIPDVPVDVTNASESESELQHSPLDPSTPSPLMLHVGHFPPSAPKRRKRYRAQSLPVGYD